MLGRKAVSNNAASNCHSAASGMSVHASGIRGAARMSRRAQPQLQSSVNASSVCGTSVLCGPLPSHRTSTRSTATPVTAQATAEKMTVAITGASACFQVAPRLFCS